MGVFSLLSDIRRFDFSEIIVFQTSLSTSLDEPGIFIKQVTPGGVAQNAGLNNSERLVEVNGESVEGLSHAQVVDMIKMAGNSLMLLVVDEEADKYNKKNSKKIRPWPPSVKHLPHKPRIAYIRKGPEGFGFTLVNDANAGRAIAAFGLSDIVKSVMAESWFCVCFVQDTSSKT